MKYRNVIIISSPITERMVKSGDKGEVDEITKQIRVGGNWFNFDNRWEVKDDKNEQVQ